LDSTTTHIHTPPSLCETYEYTVYLSFSASFTLKIAAEIYAETLEQLQNIADETKKPKLHYPTKSLM
jgi:hypothetical protein